MMIDIKRYQEGRRLGTLLVWFDNNKIRVTINRGWIMVMIMIMIMGLILKRWMIKMIMMIMSKERVMTFMKVVQNNNNNQMITKNNIDIDILFSLLFSFTFLSLIYLFILISTLMSTLILILMLIDHIGHSIYS